jgi:hypothetical protein
MFRFFFWVMMFALLLAAWLVWVLVRPTLFARRLQRVLAEYVRDRDALESEFFKAASASGKPRGLRWKQCSFQQGITLARDRANGEIVGLVGVTIAFEAVEGGGMEDVEAVGNLRAATALFTHNGQGWKTLGRAIFNLEPHEVIERYRESLDRL